MNVQNHDQIPEIALAWVQAGKTVALATVIQTWGSAPRPVGSQLVISDQAEIMGSVSGGCVEGAVIEEALELMKTGQSRVFDYGVSTEDAFAVGLACGGEIKILLEPVGSGIPLDQLEKLVAQRAARTPVAYHVNLTSWERGLAEFSPALADRFLADKSGVDDGVFTGIHNSPLKMIIVGAVHIAQPLAQMAVLAGFDLLLVDPRAAFASAGRFPDVSLSHDWPDEALKGQDLDRRTAVVTLSHDPKIDDPAITEALRSEVFYLGCLGSRRTHAKRVTRLQEAGFSETEINRIHAPVGADINAKTPAEIAISIMAQITERLRRPETRPEIRAVI